MSRELGVLCRRRLPRGSHFEMLHRVGDVYRRAIDARIHQRPVQQFAGRSDEWFAREVFRVAGLLAHEHTSADFGLRRKTV